MGWTQPMCNGCWNEQNPHREPVRMAEGYRDKEVCAFCGVLTESGIYIRVDPNTVPYPRKDIDE